MIVVFVVLIALTSPLNAQRRADLIRLVGQSIPGTVIAVSDGDTVRIRLDGTRQIIRVRLEGIDAPETGEPFSAQARNAARVLLFDKSVQVKGTDVDNYNRLVARVLVGGKDASLELLQAGLACHFTRFEHDAALARAQLDARTSGRGFWAAGAQKPRCVKFTQAPDNQKRFQAHPSFETPSNLERPSAIPTASGFSQSCKQLQESCGRRKLTRLFCERAAHQCGHSADRRAHMREPDLSASGRVRAPSVPAAAQTDPAHACEHVVRREDETREYAREQNVGVSRR